MKSKNEFSKTNIFKAACRMPSLRHNIPGVEFSYEESEVVNWILGQPETLRYLFYKLRDEGAIIYDAESGTWTGKDLI